MWDASEYDKLAEYDEKEMGNQPAAVFHCHQGDGSVCAGWLGYRDPNDLLAVRLGLIDGRLDVECLDYTTDVPLFASGADAAAHGKRDIDAPGPEAQEVIRKVSSVRGFGL